MTKSNYALNQGALKLAQMLIDEDIEWVERIDVQNNGVHITPDDVVDTKQKEDQIESLIPEEYPFTVSEWWGNRHNNETQLLIEPYYPLSPAVSKEQLECYDDFVEQYS